MEKLINGIIDFRKKEIHNYREKYSKLAGQFQSPDALFVACCDSRVVPNTFASTDPGDLFVHRNIGNIVPYFNCENICTGATIEFAVTVLKVKHIIVCGHSECGAMITILNKDKNIFNEENKDFEHLKHWLHYADKSEKRFNKKIDIIIHHQDILEHNKLSQVNVLQQIDNLMSYDIVAEKVKNGQLNLHRWWFDLATADVSYYDDSSKKFLVIESGIKYTNNKIYQ